jgi:hypothetical protein
MTGKSRIALNGPAIAPSRDSIVFSLVFPHQSFHGEGEVFLESVVMHSNYRVDYHEQLERRDAMLTQ